MRANELISLKLVIIGDSGVGKSSVLTRFVDNTFSHEQMSTIGCDFKSKQIVVDNCPVKLGIWDTAGQERYRTLTPSFYRGADGVIFVYDVNNRDSFNSMDKWLEECDTYTTKPEQIRMLVGNKIDNYANRQVTHEEGQKYAMKNTMLNFQMSALTNDGVAYAFQELVSKILQNPTLWTSDNNDKIRVTRSRSEKKCKLC